jgi:hypothetical protein
MNPAISRLLTAISDYFSLRPTPNGLEGLASMNDDKTSLADDLIWGGKGISIEIFGNDAPKYVRKTFYLLERGLIDAEKIGDQWVGSRQGLRSRFHGGQVAQATRRPSALETPESADLLSSKPCREAIRR